MVSFLRIMDIVTDDDLSWSSGQLRIVTFVRAVDRVCQAVCVVRLSAGIVGFLHFHYKTRVCVLSLPWSLTAASGGSDSLDLLPDFIASELGILSLSFKLAHTLNGG